MEQIRFDPQGIAEQRAVCDAATPGPWARCDTPNYAEIHSAEAPTTAIALVKSIRDADFIAWSRDRYPAALTEIERLQALADEKAQKWFAISLRTNGRYQAVRKRERLLQHDNAALRAQVARLQAERDAAVKDLSLESSCDTCAKAYHNGGGPAVCKQCEWQWRGPCADNAQEGSGVNG